ncbi:3,4-dihydroxy-2-butanone-4-phosphate synthase [Candidatus Peregrinibacteria bacterium]|nr:3,4-dihydroxy-2-butanone-4-phosphate synthase [Candidatus Peregrinibacteria bacterium]
MSQFDSIEDAIKDIASGKMVVVVDDEDRENEGDLVMAASLATPDCVNFMARYGRGLICAPLVADFAQRLDLPPMVENNTDPIRTNFTVSVDLKAGTTTGISMSDRSKTLMALADSKSVGEDFSRPGHIFPLVAREGGVLIRPGHTEATVDLVTLAGLPPVGVLCEIIKDNGEMARLLDLFEYAKLHGLKFITIKDLIAYRVRCAAEAQNFVAAS